MTRAYYFPGALAFFLLFPFICLCTILLSCSHPTCFSFILGGALTPLCSCYETDGAGEGNNPGFCEPWHKFLGSSSSQYKATWQTQLHQYTCHPPSWYRGGVEDSKGHWQNCRKFSSCPINPWSVFVEKWPYTLETEIISTHSLLV